MISDRTAVGYLHRSDLRQKKRWRVRTFRAKVSICRRVVARPPWSRAVMVEFAIPVSPTCTRFGRG
jgi:hypothetical protein